MFSQGNLLLIDPFIFDNGAEPKPKFFIVISTNGDDMLVASLPTSKDHIPSDIEKAHGCIEYPQKLVSCYYLSPTRQICTNDFCFRKETYIYGEFVRTMSKQIVEKRHLDSSIHLCGKLKEEELSSIIECIKNSSTTVRWIKKLL